MTSYTVRTSNLENNWGGITFVILTDKSRSENGIEMASVQKRSKWYENFLGTFPGKTKIVEFSKCKPFNQKCLAENGYTSRSCLKAPIVLKIFTLKTNCYPSYIKYAHIKAGKIPHVSVQNDDKAYSRIANQVGAYENGEHCSYSNLCCFWIRVQRHRGDDFSLDMVNKQ